MESLGAHRAPARENGGVVPEVRGLRLLLARARAEDLPASLDTIAPSALLDDERAMELAEWVYFNVEEVWSGFNLIAEAVARGFRIEATTRRLQRDLDAYAGDVRMADAVRMWVKNALVYGRCTMEASRDFLKVRNPRCIRIDQDEHGRVVKVAQDVEGTEREIPTDRFFSFTLHCLQSDDVRGVSAVHPVLQTVDDMLEARKVQRAIARRYRAPIRLIEMPADATEADRRAVQQQLEETPPEMDIVLPAGAKIHVLNHGKDAWEPDELTRQHLTDRIFMGLGIPRIALGIPDGSNRSVSEVQREMLLADKVAPYQRRVKWFAEELLGRLFGRRPAVHFDPVDVRNDKEVAEVSRILVEAGIKTPKQVEEHYWNWGPA